MRSLVRYFIIGVRVIFCNKALIISLSVVNLFLISVVVYKAINIKNELDKCILVCSNCHKMFHRKKDKVPTPKELMKSMNTTQK